jgi:hypothetical protein
MNHPVYHRATQCALVRPQFASKITELDHVLEYRASYDRYVNERSS